MSLENKHMHVQGCVFILCSKKGIFFSPSWRFQVTQKQFSLESLVLWFWKVLMSDKFFKAAVSVLPYALNLMRKCNLHKWSLSIQPAAQDSLSLTARNHDWYTAADSNTGYRNVRVELLQDWFRNWGNENMKYFTWYHCEGTPAKVTVHEGGRKF